ncbi:MAG: mechanosensitive ion channel family protein [Actinobacteria bacterium]|nr:mechanosensitive ion channel family protein [Actinomycetota bacterium]
MTEPLSRRTLELATTPARILLIVVLGVVLRALLHRAIRKLVSGAADGSVPVVLRPLHDRTKARLLEVSPLTSERRRQRAETIGSVLRSSTSILVFGVATAMVLSELRFDLGPVLASAGIVGVAVGFGAQNLIKDFLNGMFMILEDQYGVGDVIDAGEATGTVEAVGLRTTRLRDVYGTVWHIRNGEVIRVGNKSQGWARALLDIPVSWDSDVPRVREVVKAAADTVWQDEAWADKVVEEPEVWGVEDMGSAGLLIRLVVKTAPLEQWEVARELRQRVKEAFDREGIRVGVPLTDIRTAPPASSTAPKPRKPR